MAPKRGLGKGLDSLIPNSVLKPASPETLAEESKSNTAINNKTVANVLFLFSII